MQRVLPLMEIFKFTERGAAIKEVLRRENQGLKICPVDGF
jgi:hypothetical protein